MKIKLLILGVVISLMTLNCSDKKEDYYIPESEDSFEYKVDQFADLAILRYQIPGWEELTLKEKELVYYLTQAGLAGRDIMWDQKYRHNLEIRSALENIYRNFSGDKNSDNWNAFEVYLKRIWFSNGIHHHYSNDKMRPGFSKEYFDNLLISTKTILTGNAYEVIFNDKDSKMVDKTKGVDNVFKSAVNFYGPNITTEDVVSFYESKKQPDPTKPLSFGLNSKLVKEDGEVKEVVYKADGLYGESISEIIKWINKAVDVAENKPQGDALKILAEYYRTGDLKTWDDYCVAWTKATEGNIDYINGFIEVYNDPLGLRGSYENIVQINDFDMSRKMSVLSENAQWFEDNTTLMEEHKKSKVVGVSYKTVNVAGEAGDASPSTPIGVNLPNANWIRASVGSKSVSLGNIKNAYNNAGSSGRLKEFVNDEEEYELELQYGALADNMHTALHEVIGHASGQLMPGVGTPSETLKTYRSTMEEGRADLLALYYVYNSKIQELGLVDDWKAVGKASYDGYIRNGMMTQLIRLNLGDDVEQAHMRNRKWVSEWVYKNGLKDNVIEKISRDGKTYFNINDYDKLRVLFGKLLRETQRIKSEGDYDAAEKLVEGFGVKVDQDLHAEILKRNKKFKGAAYSGFVNPELIPVYNEEKELIDIEVKYVNSFVYQMLQYSDRFGFLD
ncbi:MAG: dipeptidyl peptidase 3 [Flavobacteriaceae bacterium]|nr:dipeptidyl peptidase 3 [Flavobacteriaceae bacterium]